MSLLIPKRGLLFFSIDLRLAEEGTSAEEDPITMKLSFLFQESLPINLFLLKISINYFYNAFKRYIENGNYNLTIQFQMKKISAEKIKASGDIPNPRFGHTFTMVSASKAILFGGAISVGGKFIITNQTYSFDFRTFKWAKLNFKNDFMPSERAAHSAVAVSENQLIIFGGASSNTNGVIKDELYILDARRQPVWKVIEVSGKSSPGQRYGHTMVFNKPYLVVFGGNSGNKAENDVWLLNILKGPFSWEKYQFNSKIMPCPRVYHSAAICEEGSAFGMMVVFGGRKETKKDHNGSQKQTVAALNDIWGLRKHRDGSWDWVTPPKSQKYTPISRYQHLICFLGSTLLILGGRSSNPEDVINIVQMYDTETSQWSRSQSISRYRHAIALYNKNKLYVHGGFQPELATQPLQSLTCLTIDLNSLKQNQEQEVFMEQKNFKKTNKIKVEKENQNHPRTNSMITTFYNQKKTGLKQTTESQKNMIKSSRTKSHINKERQLTPSKIINSIKTIKLANQAVVAVGDNNHQIQRVPLNSLLEQSKKLTSGMEDSVPMENFTSAEFADNIIGTLLPKQSKVTSSSLFPFKKDKVIRLCQEAIKVVLKDNSLVGVKPPVKIFGSIYGRYYDLIKIFESFGYPDEHEMQCNEYLFLGNYVDKGFNSLETVCLLMALKIKYPEHMILLRGKHQDSAINKICGLGEECSVRLGQNIEDINSAFNFINHFFDSLPLAAAIEDHFLCVHSGIGSIQDLISIKDVVRPVKVQQNQTVMDLLWSGSKNEGSMGYSSKRCSEQQMNQFLQNNGIQMIINTKDKLPQGIDEDNNTLSVFSVRNYANSNNKGCMLKIGKDLSVTPCIINTSPTKRGIWVSDIPSKSSISLNAAQSQYRLSMFTK